MFSWLGVGPGGLGTWEVESSEAQGIADGWKVRVSFLLNCEVQRCDVWNWCSHFCSYKESQAEA